jgi:hypothetical protein
VGLEKNRKEIYERYMGLRGFPVSSPRLAVLYRVSPCEIYDNVRIYMAYLSCGVEKPDFESESDRNAFIYDHYKGVNGCVKLKTMELAGMFDLKTAEVRKIIQACERTINKSME